jgi:hypothetical protein
MKLIVFILLLFFSLSACSKQDSHLPVPVERTLADQGMSLISFSGVWNQGSVQLQFALSGDLSKITDVKIFSGSNSNQLCLIGELAVNKLQASAGFSYTDPAPKGSPTYYMIGIEDNQGHVTYVNNILSVSKPSGLEK